MGIDSENAVRLTRKLGYGLRPDEAIPEDVAAWAKGQLASIPLHVGIARLEAPHEILPWPKPPDIKSRALNSTEFARIEVELEKQFARDSGEFREALLEAEKALMSQVPDKLRVCHQPVYSAAPVFHRFANFWANHFTAANAGNAGDSIGHFLDAAIGERMTGSFADLLYDVTTHPAMQTFLDNPASTGPNSEEGKGNPQANINENLARELMELHTVSSRYPYGQDDVIAVANILSGWGYWIIDADKVRAPLGDYWHVFQKSKHEPGKKTALGIEYPAGPKALRQFTDFLAAEPATAEFISFKLARHFIAEDPAPEDVASITSAWQESKGDLPAIHAAVIDRTVAASGARKFMQPLTWLHQMVRCSGATLWFGFEQAFEQGNSEVLRDSHEIPRELGMNYWDQRQPDGFSDLRAAWISNEHMDRRVRFAQLVWRAGAPQLAPMVLAERLAAAPETLTLMAKARSEEEQFIFLFCSPDMMEA